MSNYLRTVFTLILFLFITVNFYSCKCCSKKKSTKEITECEKNCLLAPEGGKCRAYFPKYYYDKEEGKCKEFIWGGCDDGVIPFHTMEECEQCDCKEYVK